MAFALTDFTNGTLADADDLTANHTLIENELNGSTFTSTNGIMRFCSFANSSSTVPSGGTNTTNIDNSATETVLGSVEINQNTIGTGALIIVTGDFRADAIEDDRTTAIKIYYDTSKDGTTNQIETITVRDVASQTDTGSGDGVQKRGANNWTCTTYTTAPTFSSDVWITVTGQNSSANSGQITTCHQILVFGW